jgi:hypothetical protein
MLFLHLFFTNINEYNNDSAFRTLVTILSYMILIYNFASFCLWTKYFIQSVFKSNINFLSGITLTLKILKCLRLDKIETYEKYLLKKIGIDKLALYIPANNLKAVILQHESQSGSSTNNNINDDTPQGTNRRMLSTRGVL